MTEILTDRIWQAIVDCDSAYDRTFYYGVKTTGIFCRPSCKSKTPLRENVWVFRKAHEALENRFRPCKRCKPDGMRLPDEEWTARMSEWIREHYGESITLERLAEAFHSSRYHLQRTFKKVEGVTPAAYLLEVRMNKARELLGNDALTVSEIANRVGIPSAAHFATLFARMTGLTPTQYRKRPNNSY